MKKFFTLLILSFFVSSIFAQFNYKQGSIKQKKYLQIVPYQKVKGLPVIPVIINGNTYNFIFDTGASGLIISDKLFKELNLPIIGSIDVGSSSGEYKKMRLTSLPALYIQELTFINTQGLVFHEDFELFECLGIDGFIGSSMLKKSVVQFDEQSKHIIITDNIKNLSLKKSFAKKIELSSKHAPLISVVLQKGAKRVRHKVMFDSGQSDFFDLSINVFNWLNGRMDIVDKIAESEGVTSFGIHGIPAKQNHLSLNVPELIINEISFKDVVTTTTNGSNSRIGSKLFEYGTVTLDYNKKRFYFNSFDNISKNDLSRRPWSILSSPQNDKLVVGIIWNKALESEINLGDEIVSINGINIQSMDECELLRLDIPESEVRIYELRDINTGEVKIVEINRI